MHPTAKGKHGKSVRVHHVRQRVESVCINGVRPKVKAQAVTMVAYHPVSVPKGFINPKTKIVFIPFKLLFDHQAVCVLTGWHAKLIGVPKSFSIKGIKHGNIGLRAKP